MASKEVGTAVDASSHLFLSPEVEANPFMPEEWGVVKEYTQEYIDRSPVNGTTLTVTDATQTSSWVLKPQEDLILSTLFKRRVSQLAGADASRRFVDYYGYFSINEVRVSYQNRDLYRVTGEELYLIHRLFLSTNPSTAVDDLVAGNLTDAERITLAADVNGQEIYTPLWLLPWMQGQRHGLLIGQLPSEVHIDIIHERESKVIQSTDAMSATSHSLSEIALRTESVHIHPDDRGALERMVNDPNTDGVVYKIIDIEKHTRVAVGAADTTTSIQLSNVRNPVSWFALTFRDQADVNSADPSTADPTDFKAITNFRLLTAGSDETVRTVTDKFRSWINGTHFSGFPNPKIYTWSFARAPEDLVNASGLRALANLVNPTLEVNYSAPGSARYIDAYFFVHNTIQHHRGSLVKNFV